LTCAPKSRSINQDRLRRAPLLRFGYQGCYLTTPEINPGLRRGGLISFFKKQ
jgi:hypothetical protein